MTNGTHIPQEDLVLYAMQTLTSEESADVRLHLDACETCRAELADIYGDLSFVSMAVDQHPLPAGARQRFIDRIAADGGTQAEEPARVIQFDPARSRRRLSSFPWLAIAALLLVSLGLGLEVYRLNEEVRQRNATIAAANRQLTEQAAAGAQAQRVLDLLTARNAQRVLLTAANVHPAPSARAVYLPSRGALLLQASNLSPIPADKTYELWVIPANGSAPIPAGLFRPDAQGSASVVLPELPAGVAAKAFGVTIEKASGASVPTLPIVLAGAAPATGE